MSDLLHDLPEWAQWGVIIGLVIGVAAGSFVVMILWARRYLSGNNLSILNGTHAASMDGMKTELTKLVVSQDHHETKMTERHVEAREDRGDLFALAHGNSTAIATNTADIRSMGGRLTRGGL